jgi:ATP-dependent DNA helicase Rep
VGSSTLSRLSGIAGAKGESLFAAVFDAEFRAAVPARQREALDGFCGLIDRLRHRAEREPAGRLLDELIAAIGYEDWLATTLDKRDCEVRSQSVRDFTGWLSRKGEVDGRNLLELTQMIALVTRLEDREGESGDAVRLSTLHAAKGLEFPHVFLVGLEEGLLPHREAIEAGNVDEERRLMYVGVTRAERTLHLSYCRTRKRAGERVDVMPSRFLSELSQDDLRYADAPPTAEDAAREKQNGSERLKALKALVAR